MHIDNAGTLCFYVTLLTTILNSIVLELVMMIFLYFCGGLK